jgi:hypothetical protein
MRSLRSPAVLAHPAPAGDRNPGGPSFAFPHDRPSDIDVVGSGTVRHRKMPSRWGAAAGRRSHPAADLAGVSGSAAAGPRKAVPLGRVAAEAPGCPFGSRFISVILMPQVSPRTKSRLRARDRLRRASSIWRRPLRLLGKDEVCRFVDANKRRFGLRDSGVGPVARCQTHQLHPSCGTE